MSSETITCPFCGAKTVKVIKHPAHREYKRSRGSGQSSGQWVYVPEKIEVLSGCPNCNASKSEIQRALDHGQEKRRQLDVKALLQRVKEKRERE